VERELEHRPAVGPDPGGDALAAHGGLDLEGIAGEEFAPLVAGDALGNVGHGLRFAAIHAIVMLAADVETTHDRIEGNDAGWIEFSFHRQALLVGPAATHDGRRQLAAFPPPRGPQVTAG
jgi:hypothetical protein